jgi:hypothetical protein
VRSRAGHREFDFNTDGLAHIGMLPDFIRDLVHVGLTDAQLEPLFSSAEAFLRMWEACESRAEALAAGEPLPDSSGLGLADGTVRPWGALSSRKHRSS